LIKKSLKILKG